MTVIDRAILQPVNPILQAGLGGIPDSLLSRLNSAHVDRDACRWQLNAIVVGAACIVGNTRARDECFGRSAARVDARSAKQVTFNDRDGFARAGKACRQGRSGLASTDDNGIVFEVHSIAISADEANANVLCPVLVSNASFHAGYLALRRAARMRCTSRGMEPSDPRKCCIRLLRGIQHESWRC